MAITAAERHEIAELLVLMFNAAPGATYLSQIVAAYESVGKDLKALANVLAAHPAYEATHPNFWTAEDFAEALLAPLGLSTDFRATTAVIEAYNDGVPPGEITYAAYVFLNDVLAAPPGMFAPQYVNAANIMDNKADVSIYYSVTKGLSATNLADLQAVLEGVTADNASVTAAQSRIDTANDPQQFTLTVDSPSVTEGDSGIKFLTFTITAIDQDGDAPVAATVFNWATSSTGATATANDDYQVAAGQVTFAPGQSTATVQVAIIGDTVYENNGVPETVKIVVSGGASVAGVTGTGTIVENDPEPQQFVATISSPTVTEGDTGNNVAMSFTITLNQAPTAPVTFSYETLQPPHGGAGTATAGSDYTATSGTVTFAVGQTTATVTVIVTGDDAIEADETIALRVFGSQLPVDAFATGIILNDDTFELTTGRDIVDGSANDDTITGTQDTFTLADSIDGAEGEDTLLLIFDGAIEDDPEVIIAPFVEVENVENVTIFSDLSVGSTDGQVFDMADWVGVENLVINTAGGADVNVTSNVSGTIDIDAGDNVILSDNTVDTIIVEAGGGADVTAMGASSITVDGQGDRVNITASDVDTIVARSVSDVTIVAQDVGSLTVDSGSDVTIVASDVTTLDIGGYGANEVSDVDVEINSLGTGTITAHSDVEVDVGGYDSDGIYQDGEVTSLTITGSDVDVDAGAVGTLNITASADVDVDAQSIDSLDASVTDGAGITATNLVGWSNDGIGSDDVTIDIDGSDAFINAAEAGFIGVTNASEVDIFVGSLGAVALTNVYSDVEITEVADTAASDAAAFTLTVSDVNIDLHIRGVDEVDLVVNGDSSIVMSDDSTVETLNITGSGDLVLNLSDDVDVLTTINAGDYTGNLTLEAIGGSEDINITSGTGSDDIEIHGGAGTNVTIDAGAGNNTVDVDTYGVVQVTVSDGDDSVTVNFDALAVSDSFVALGAGENTLTLRSVDALSEGDLDNFDLSTMPITGSLSHLVFDADVVLAEGSSSTLNVAGLEGSVESIQFDSVTVDDNASSDESADLIITGASDELTLISLGDFGSEDGHVINLDAGASTLTIDAGGEVGVALMGDDLETLDVDGEGSVYVDLDGDVDDDGTQEQLADVRTVNVVSGEDAEVDIFDMDTVSVGDAGLMLTIDADEDAHVDIGDATIGNVDIDFGHGEDAMVHINGSSEDEAVVVGSITVDDSIDSDVGTIGENDDGGSIEFEIDNNDFTTVDVGQVTLTVDGDVEIDIDDNNHSTVNVAGIVATSRWNGVDMTIEGNEDNEVGPDATINIGDVTLNFGGGGGFSDDVGASLEINDNVDGNVYIEDLVLAAASSDTDGSATVHIFGNDEATVEIDSVDITSGYSAAWLWVSDNDSAEVNIGGVTIEAYSSVSDVGVWIEEQHDSEVTLGAVDITNHSGYATFEIDGNSDNTSIDVASVSVWAEDEVEFTISDNEDSEISVLGPIVLTSSEGDVDVEVLGSSNSDTDIELGNFDINAGGMVTFDVIGCDDNSSDIAVGSVTIMASDEVDFTLTNASAEGAISVTAGGNVGTTGSDVGFLLSDVDGVTTIDIVASDANVLITDVSDVESVEITANGSVLGLSDGDVLVGLADVQNLTSLTVNADGTAGITLSNVNSDSAFTLDITGVEGLATVDASDADFISNGTFVTIKLGNGDVTYTNDQVMDGDVADGSREKFVFGATAGADDVGDVVINDFTPGATAALNGVWTDRLDFSMLDDVDNLDDLTFAVVGDDVVIDFVESDYGSITLTGVGAEYANATDLVIASIIFA